MYYADETKIEADADKANLSFTKFHLRGNKKVKVEFGLVAIAHNIINMTLNRSNSFYKTHKESTNKRHTLYYI